MGDGSARFALRRGRLRHEERPPFRTEHSERDLNRLLLLPTLALGLLLASGSGVPAHAQRGAWMDVGAGRSRWPGDSVALGQPYLLFGGRGEWMAPSGSGADGSLTLGHPPGADAAAGWLAGDAGAMLARQRGPFSLEVEGRAWGTRYQEETRYTAAGLTLRPRIELEWGGWLLGLQGEEVRGGWEQEQEVLVLPAADGEESPPAGAGNSDRKSKSKGKGKNKGGKGGSGSDPGTVEPGPDPAPVLERHTLSDDLRLRGGSLDLARSLGPAWLRVTAGRYLANNGFADGSYSGIDAEFGYAVGRWAGGVGGRWWRVPGGRADVALPEAGFHAEAQLQLTSALSAGARLERAIRDPLYGTPGGTAAHLGLSWKLGEHGGAVRAVVAVGRQTDEGRRVEFRIRAPDAAQVALVGDFSAWQPMPMRERGGYWEGEVILGPGTHHFAFLVDGETWTVPPEAPGIADDGWGRHNASVVIPS